MVTEHVTQSDSNVWHARASSAFCFTSLIVFNLVLHSGVERHTVHTFAVRSILKIEKYNELVRINAISN
jgi:hypothetical protein